MAIVFLQRKHESGIALSLQKTIMPSMGCCFSIMAQRRGRGEIPSLILVPRSLSKIELQGQCRSEIRLLQGQKSHRREVMG